MCGGGSPKAPKPPPALPEAPRTPEPAVGAKVSDKDKRRRAAAAAGDQPGSTILTGPRGVTEQGATQQKVLLGA